MSVISESSFISKTYVPYLDICNNLINESLLKCKITKSKVEGLVNCPSHLNIPDYLPSVALAEMVGLSPRKNGPFIVRSIYEGGMSPIAALQKGKELVDKQNKRDLVLVLAVESFPHYRDFVKFLNDKISPIVDGKSISGVATVYDELTTASIKMGHVTREQLASVPVYDSHRGTRHPKALDHKKQPRTLSDVLNSKKMAKNTTMLECAYPCIGGVCFVVASHQYLYDQTFHLKKYNITPVSIKAYSETTAVWNIKSLQNKIKTTTTVP
eukprot:UN30411